MNPEVDIVFCFLIMDQLHPVWNEWLRQTHRIGAVVHAKTQCPVGHWFHEYCIHTQDTAWASPLLVRAELALYAEARNRYPNAEYFVFLSGDSVPLFYPRSTRHAIRHAQSTVLYEDEPDEWGHGPRWQSSTSAGVPRVGHQWKVLLREHVDLLLDDTRVRKRINQLLSLREDAWYDERYNFNSAFDEMVIPTVLIPYMNDRWVNGFICDFTSPPSGQRHPVTYTRRNRKSLRAAILSARSLQAENNPVWFFRKVAADVPYRAKHRCT